jgi:regulator of nucleoside diphosphate kinase
MSIIFFHDSSSRLFHASPVQLTEHDVERLRSVIDRHIDGVEGPAAEMLEAELDRAHVMTQDDLPPDVVSMRSRVVYEDVDTGEQREAVLVYPEEADLARSLISVLAPIGTALLGLRTGQFISWPVPGRRTRTIRVLSVVYQPEAAGDRHL